MSIALRLVGCLLSLIYFKENSIIAQKRTFVEKDTLKMVVAYEKKGLITAVAHDQLSNPEMLIPFDKIENKISVKNYQDSIFLLRLIDFPDYEGIISNHDTYLIDNVWLSKEILRDTTTFFSHFKLKIPPFEKKTKVYGFHRDTLMVDYVLMQMKVVVTPLGISTVQILNLDKRRKKDMPIINVSPRFFLVEEIMHVEN
ncbi:MAG: hypothetical protein R3C61_28475 [Bacteroidia bacterium]